MVTLNITNHSDAAIVVFTSVSGEFVLTSWQMFMEYMLNVLSLAAQTKTNPYVESQPQRRQERRGFFLFSSGNPSETMSKNLLVCANHFKPECFINLLVNDKR